jgi:hypothetical protein
MSNSLLMFREPDLEFRYNQRVKDPRDGLALFGPYDTDLAGHPQSVPYIVLGRYMPLMTITVSGPRFQALKRLFIVSGQHDRFGRTRLTRLVSAKRRASGKRTSEPTAWSNTIWKGYG